MHLPPFPLLLIASFALPATAATSTTVLTTTGTSPPSATSTSYTSASAFESAMLDAHNFYRKEHNASALTWNSTSATYAANWANNCKFEHSGGPTGENLAEGYANASAAVDAWGLEREKYNWGSPGFSESTGHFTQVVWGNTTTVGCGRMSCGSSGFIVVCEYYPAGNVEGDGNQFFKDNVKKQVVGHKTDTVESGVTSAGTGLVDVRWSFVVFGGAVIAGLGMVW